MDEDEEEDKAQPAAAKCITSRRTSAAEPAAPKANYFYNYSKELKLGVRRKVEGGERGSRPCRLK